MPADWLRLTKDAQIVAGAIDLQGAALTVWFRILEYALANHLTQNLVNRLLTEHPEWHAVCTAYLAELSAGELPTPALPGVTTDDRIQTARAGLYAVNQQSQDIQSELAAGNGLARATELIDTLAAYKDLHDGLQSFQYSIGSFQGLLLAARRMNDDLEEVRVLQKFLRQLRLLCQHMADTVATLPQGPTLRDIEQAWLDDLVAAAANLQAALDQKTPAAYDAIYDVRTVLRVVPSRLNKQIFVTAKNVPFATMADGLGVIVQKLPVGDLAAPTINAARDSIMVLSSTIYARVIEHKLWQDVDNKLADLADMVEPANGSGLASGSLPFQFSPVWRNLELKVQTLSQLDAGGHWRTVLGGYATGVNDQLSREIVDSAFILAFEAYRDEAQQRFVQVDLALKRECGSLTLISEPLHKLLGSSQP